jgi:hypothetical protein
MVAALLRYGSAILSYRRHTDPIFVRELSQFEIPGVFFEIEMPAKIAAFHYLFHKNILVVKINIHLKSLILLAFSAHQLL